ncbi:MAG: LVIVD repeat-containing protein, partial [Candidatus Heimdallarchaeaceae archaeon]
MKKHKKSHIKKTLAGFLIVLFFGNFLGITSYIGSITLNASANSDDQFNSYVGTNCTKLGEYDSNYGIPEDCYIIEHSARTLALILENKGFIILDVTNPEDPIFLNFLLKDKIIRDLCIDGNYLYVSIYNANLQIYEIQDILNPVIVFNEYFDVLFSLDYMTVQDEILYASDSGKGLVIFNVTNHTNPQFISRYHTGYYNSYYYDVVVLDDFAYLSHRNSLRIVNITHIEDPTLVGIFSSTEYYDYFRKSHIENNKAYICAESGAFHILDITNKSNPIQIGLIWDESKYFTNFYLDDSIGFLLERRDGLSVLNLTDLHRITYLHTEYNDGLYYSFTYKDGYLFLIDQYEGLEIYKVKHDNSLELVSRFSDGGYARAIKVRGNHAFVA